MLIGRLVDDVASITLSSPVLTGDDDGAVGVDVEIVVVLVAFPPVVIFVVVISKSAASVFAGISLVAVVVIGSSDSCLFGPSLLSVFNNLPL